MSDLSNIGEKGKYDQYAQFIQHEADAALVAVIVLNGKHGHGFSVCSADHEAHLKLPGLMRTVADLIEKQNKGIKAN